MVTLAKVRTASRHQQACCWGTFIRALCGSVKYKEYSFLKYKLDQTKSPCGDLGNKLAFISSSLIRIS